MNLRLFFSVTFISAFSFVMSDWAAGQTSPATPAKRPVIERAMITKPKAPATSSTAPSPGSDATVAPIVVTAFDETAYTAASSKDGVVLLVFSGQGDNIWTQQAAILTNILREPEFAKMVVFQVDVTNMKLSLKFGVTLPGTLLVMKGGVERLRSNRMIKADPIRKMLRLSSIL